MALWMVSSDGEDIAVVDVDVEAKPLDDCEMVGSYSSVVVNVDSVTVRLRLRLRL